MSPGPFDFVAYVFLAKVASCLLGKTMRTNRSEPKRILKRVNRRGAAVVEFALILPVLLTLLVGSIELGRAITVRQTVAEAARAGARVLSMRTIKTTVDARAIIDQVMSNAGLKDYTVEITPDASADIAQLDPVSVKVSIKAGDAAWFSTPWFMDSSQLISSSCVMPADLGETAADDIEASSGGDSDIAVDDDSMAELSGTDDATLKELEKQAQELVEKAKKLREEADELREDALKVRQEASDASLKGDAKKLEQKKLKYYELLAKADEAEKQALEAERLAQEMLQKVIQASK